MPKKHREVPILTDDGGSQKGSQRWSTKVPHHAMTRAGPWLRHHVVWRPWPTTGSAPSRTSSPQNPKTRGAIEEIFHRLHEAENNRKRKALRQGEICRGNSFPEGEIVAIVTVIELDFIGIIITIISTADTVISTAPLRSAVTSRGESCLVHRGNFPGVNYSLWLMLLSETVELRFMSRLLFIIISSMIMFHMMSCE